MSLTYRLRPSTVEAIEWDGKEATLQDIRSWGARVERYSGFHLATGSDGLRVLLSEHWYAVPLNAVLLRDQRGRISLMSHDMFHATYEAVVPEIVTTGEP